MQRKHHFTLAELTLVAATGALLMTLLLAAADAVSPGAAAESLACQNNQKKIAAALTAYCTNNAGFLPYFDDESGIRGCKTRATWSYKLYKGKYLPADLGNAVLFCPTAQKIYTGDTNRSLMESSTNCVADPDDHPEYYRSINYGINFEYLAGNVGHWHSRNTWEYVTMKLAAIVNPKEKLVVTDAGTKEGGRNVVSSVDAGSNRIHARHNGGANVMWADGHVSLVNKPAATLQGPDRLRYFRGDR